MRKTDRLFQIIQILRGARQPLTADQIAAEVETSRWTVYRDINALIGQRVPIRGEAGIGYVLERGFVLPPLMLTLDEIEAIALGTQWVAANGDDALARAASDAHAKVAAVLPEPLRAAFDEPAVATPKSRRGVRPEKVDVGKLRASSRQGRKLALRYVDDTGTSSERTVWPFLVGYVGGSRVLAAWCELRDDFRMFRTDRITGVEFLDEAYPVPRAALRRRWLARVEQPAGGLPPTAT